LPEVSFRISIDFFLPIGLGSVAPLRRRKCPAEPGLPRVTRRGLSLGAEKVLPEAMAKKKAGRGKVGSECRSKTKSRRTTKHIDSLLALSRMERNSFFEDSPPDKLLIVLDESYPADLVNLLLDLKKSTVRRFFEVAASSRKRIVTDMAALYYYREYLTNPLPLQVETDSGESVPNCYAILGAPRDATDDELKTAYRLLVRAFQSDMFSPALRKSGAERLNEIHDAYENLKSPVRRRKADRLLPNISYLYPRRDQTWYEAVQRVLS
jgi:hypothetical protein